MEGSISLNGRKVVAPGPDRVFVFQEFDQLLPWKTVKQNIAFALTSSGKLTRRDADERALHFIEKVKLTEFANSYPHTPLGRHETARRNRARHGDGTANPCCWTSHSRPSTHSRVPACRRNSSSSGTTQNSPVLFVTHSIPEAIRVGSRILLLSAHPGQVKAEINSEGTDEARIESMLFDHAWISGRKFRTPWSRPDSTW